MRSYLLVFFALFLGFSVEAQVADLLRLEYTNVPLPQSDFRFERKRVLFNFPISLQKSRYMFVGLDYSAIDLEFKDQQDGFDQTKTEDFRLLDLNITYTSLINETWRFGARIVPGFSSNLEEGGLFFEDTILSGVVVLIKDKKESPEIKKPFRIIVGLAYSGNSGIVFPIPFISYYKKFHPKWSYNVGVPVMNFQYHASERFRVKAFAQLDGFNSNLQDGVDLEGSRPANRIRLAMGLLGLRYEYKIAWQIELFMNTTYSVYTRMQLRDRRENLILLDNGNFMHYNGGVRVKI